MIFFLSYLLIGAIFAIFAIARKGPNQPSTNEQISFVAFVSIFFWLPITLFLFWNRLTTGSWEGESN
jgi:hypothetical protein